MSEHTVEIAALKSIHGQACVHAQVVENVEKLTRDGKPFHELTLADATARFVLRIWSDHPDFARAARYESGLFLSVTAEFSTGPFGLEAKAWKARELEPLEISTLLEGSPEVRAKQEGDFATIRALVLEINDPRLSAVCSTFLDEFGDRFRRSAAARSYHHARRGGLVEHVASMMRSAVAVCDVYTMLNRDLLLAGVLFHDCGKLWENCYDENAFTMQPGKPGELLGHIIIGTELVNHLFHRAGEAAGPGDWSCLNPPTEDVRLHLLHLIGSHHGTAEFGSPVNPKTPEATALHHIDNLDAKLEMIFQAVETAPRVSASIIDRVRPLPGRLVVPLPVFTTDSVPSGSSAGTLSQEDPQPPA